MSDSTNTDSALPILHHTSSWKFGLWGVGFGFITGVAVIVTTVEVFAGRAPENLLLVIIGLMLFSAFSATMLYRALRPGIAFRLDENGLTHGKADPIPWHDIDGAMVGYSEGTAHVILHLKAKPTTNDKPTAAEVLLNQAEGAIFRTEKLSTDFAQVSADRLAEEINGLVR